MLSHMILFRGFFFGSRNKRERANAQAPLFTPCEWAAFNRALYQHKPKRAAAAA